MYTNYFLALTHRYARAKLICNMHCYRLWHCLKSTSHNGNCILQIFCIFLFLAGSSLFGTLLSQVTEILFHAKKQNKLLSYIFDRLNTLYIKLKPLVFLFKYRDKYYLSTEMRQNMSLMLKLKLSVNVIWWKLPITSAWSSESISFSLIA